MTTKTERNDCIETLRGSDRLGAQYFIETLRAELHPGDTVYTILRHVSRSGMFRALDLEIIHDGQPRRITWQAARAAGDTYSTKYEALTVSGCGMDMGFHVVYNLSRVLFPDGFNCIGDRCPSNDHANRKHNDHHRDGGYALIHRWL